ncbi:MAG: hypothetical protein WA001_02350 [Patescibacteria group bacterium]
MRFMKTAVLRQRRFEAFAQAVKLYAGEDRYTADVRETLTECLYQHPVEDVLERFSPAEIAAILSASVTVNQTVLMFVEHFPPGSLLQHNLHDLDDGEMLPLIADPRHPAAWFLRNLVWGGVMACEAYKQITQLLVDAAQEPSLKRFLPLLN